MGIRETQFFGLSERAEAFLRLNQRVENVRCSCPDCAHDHVVRPVSEVCGDARSSGMFDDGPMLHRHQLQNGEWLEEFVQDDHWSSGPCIFLALKGQKSGKPLELSLWSDKEIGEA